MRADGMRGTTLPELLVALAITLIVASGLARAVVDAGAIFVAQPETSDLVQRGRVGLAWLVDDLAVAGGGPYRVGGGGPLVRWVPPIHPRRLGPERPDAGAGGVLGPDHGDDHPGRSPSSGRRGEGLVHRFIPIPIGTASCPPGDVFCGFEPDQQLLAFDSTSTFEATVVASMAPGALVPIGPMGKAYLGTQGARVAGVRLVTYYLDPARRQLRRYDGDRTDVPVADDVVGLELRVLGWPFPPDEPRPPRPRTTAS